MMNDFMVLMVKLQYIAFEPLLVELVLFTCGRKEMVGREYMTLSLIVIILLSGSMLSFSCFECEESGLFP